MIMPLSYNGYFVDLFVRESNKVAIAMYEGFGYTLYRRVLDYYSGSPGVDDEDAYGRCISDYISSLWRN